MKDLLFADINELLIDEALSKNKLAELVLKLQMKYIKKLNLDSCAIDMMSELGSQNVSSNKSDIISVLHKQLHQLP